MGISSLAESKILVLHQLNDLIEVIDDSLSLPVLVDRYSEYSVISFGRREGNLGSCDPNSRGGCKSHLVHVLGCEERP